MSKQKLLTLGSWVNRNGWRGRVAQIGWLGERYYWLIDVDGSVAMVPASALE